MEKYKYCIIVYFCIEEKYIMKQKITCQAPSNIALVKYWGKKTGVADQIPANPSISFTLTNCKTITKLGFERKPVNGVLTFDLLFEGEPKPDFKPKIEQFLCNARDIGIPLSTPSSNFFSK